MKRIVSMILVLVLVLTALPVSVRASEAEIVEEDVVLDYGSFAGEEAGLELMAAGSGKTYEMADIPEGGKYKNMTASQEIIDVIKDFEGFRSKAYWDNSQWSVGYGTRCSGSGVTVTRAEAERLLRKVIEDTYGPVVNKFCKEIGKQPNQQQFDALLDLTYNVGGGWTTGSSVPDVLTGPVTALELVKGFGAWSRSGGGVSYVHVNRRIREALIFLYGEYYLAYGGQDCKSGLEIVSNDDLPHFKAVIFKTNSGKLDNGKTDYAGYYAEGEYYGSFPGGTRSGYTLVGWKITKRGSDSVSGDVRASIWDKAQENLELTAVWQKGNVVVKPEEPPVDYEEPTEPETERDPDRYEPGYRTEDYWCSEFMGLQFHLPAGYFMADDAYYAELMQISAEVMGENGQLYTDYTKINSVYEMMAQDYMGNNVIVIAERTPWEVTTEEYIDSLAAQLVNVTGISYSITSIDVVNFAGMEFGSLEVIADYNSVTIHQRYLIQSRGERVISIVMSSVNPDTLDTMQNFFEPYN